MTAIAAFFRELDPIEGLGLSLAAALAIYAIFIVVQDRPASDHAISVAISNCPPVLSEALKKTEVITVRDLQRVIDECTVLSSRGE